VIKFAQGASEVAAFAKEVTSLVAPIHGTRDTRTTVRLAARSYKDKERKEEEKHISGGKVVATSETG
jgi:hypothetical protein